MANPPKKLKWQYNIVWSISFPPHPFFWDLFSVHHSFIQFWGAHNQPSRRPSTLACGFISTRTDQQGIQAPIHRLFSSFCDQWHLQKRRALTWKSSASYNPLCLCEVSDFETCYRNYLLTPPSPPATHRK